MPESLFARALRFIKAAKDAWGIIVWLVPAAAWTTLVLYLGHITEWAQMAGPLGLLLLAQASLFILVVCFAIYAKASEGLAISGYAKAKAAAGHVESLAKTHENERINTS